MLCYYDSSVNLLFWNYAVPFLNRSDRNILLQQTRLCSYSERLTDKCISNFKTCSHGLRGRLLRSAVRSFHVIGRDDSPICHLNDARVPRAVRIAGEARGICGDATQCIAHAIIIWLALKSTYGSSRDIAFYSDFREDSNRAIGSSRRFLHNKLHR